MHSSIELRIRDRRIIRLDLLSLHSPIRSYCSQYTHPPINPKSLLPRLQALFQLILLHVRVPFHITPFIPPNRIPHLLHRQARDRRLRRRREPAPVIVQMRREAIPAHFATRASLGVRPVVLEEPRHALRHPKQHNKLIEQVRAEVVNRATRSARLEFPRRRLCGWRVDAPPVEARVDVDQAAQGSGVEKSAESEEIAVPAPVLVHGEDESLVSCELGKLQRFGRGGHEGLFADDVFACLEGRFDLFVVRVWRGGYDDEVDGGGGGVGEHGGVGGPVKKVGVVGWRGVGGGRGALDDAEEGEEGRKGDEEGGMEDLVL